MMKSIVRPILFSFVLAGFFVRLNFNAPACAETPEETRLTVMSFNVLCSFCTAFGKEDFDPWNKRLHYFVDLIGRHDPDLIGLQELSNAEEVDRILAMNPGYDALYYSETVEGKRNGYPDACILYRRDRFEALESGTWWLSEEPDKPWTKGWADGFQFWRVVEWARLREKTGGRELYFASTHFDPNNPNQEKSAAFLMKRFAALAERAPVIFVGDFNSTPESAAYKILTEQGSDGGFRFLNAFDIAGERKADSNRDVNAAFRAYEAQIDHIFLAGKGDFRVPVWTADLHVYGPKDRFPSDHKAIVADVELLGLK